jgi:hypothetical protein
MEIGWTDMGSGGYILVSCAHSNTSFISFSVKTMQSQCIDGAEETRILLGSVEGVEWIQWKFVTICFIKKKNEKNCCSKMCSFFNDIILNWPETRVI